MQLIKSEKWNLFLWVGFILGIFLFAYRKLLGCGMIGYADASTFPFDAQTALQFFISSWQPLAHGTTAPPTMIALYKAILLFFCHNNAIIAAKIFHFSALPLACFTMYLFLARFIRLRPAKIIASLIYVVNPPTIGNFLGGSIGILYAHAFFPLVMIFLFNMHSDALEGKRRLKNTLLFSLFLTLAYSFSTHILIFVLPAIMLVLINILWRKGFLAALISALTFTSALILCFLLTLPFSFYLFSIVQPFVPGAGSPVAGQTLKDLLWTVKYCFGKSRIINILRLGAEHLWFLGYVENHLWALLGFVLPLLAFSALFFSISNRRRKYTLGFSILAVGVILFIWLTKMGPALHLFKYLPFLLNFRNPSRPTMFLAFTYAPLIAITITEIQKRLTLGKQKKEYLKLTLTYITIIICLSVYMWPFFTGEMGLTGAGRNRIDIQEIFLEAGDWLTAQRGKEGFFRTYWVPLDWEPTEVSLRWIDPHRLGFPLGGELYRLPGQDYAQFLAQKFCDSNSRHLGALLAPANVRYIIVNLTSSQEGPCKPYLQYPQGDPKIFIKVLNRQQDLKLKASNENFVIYENREFIPHIGIYETALFVPQFKDRTPFGQLSELSCLSDFRINDQLIVFEKQLSLEEKEWFLSNPNTVRLISSKFPKFRPYSEKIKCIIHKISATQYQITLNSPEPVFIVLGELYHPSWSAHCQGKKLKHFPTLFGNGFYLERTGENRIRILFEEQKKRNLTLIVAALSWFLLFGGLVSTVIKERPERKIPG